MEITKQLNTENLNPSKISIQIEAKEDQKKTESKEEKYKSNVENSQLEYQPTINDFTGLKHAFYHNDEDAIIRRFKSLSRQEAKLIKSQVEGENERVQLIEENNKYKNAMDGYLLSMICFSLIGCAITYFFTSQVGEFLATKFGKFVFGATCGIAISNPFAISNVNFYNFKKEMTEQLKNNYKKYAKKDIRD